jgi:PPP family 3-phenylpropionic acid transporter
MRLYYFAFFANIGIIIPYLPLYFQSLGMSPIQIGVLTSIAPLGRPFFAGAWTVPAERTGMRHPALILTSWLSAGAFALYLWPTTFAGLILATLVVAATHAPVHAFAEATVLDAVRTRGVDYGKVRVWGSVGFVSAAGLLGWVLVGAPVRSVLYAMLGCGVLVAVACLALPRPGPARHRSRSSLRGFLSQPGVAAFYLSSLLMQASHGAYYTFFSIHMAAQGHSIPVIGLLWGLGVVSEMVIMVVFSRLQRGIRPSRLLVLCFLLASARWVVYGLSASLWVAIPAQILHAFTFGAFHMAAVTATQRIFPDDIRASGQAVYSGVTFGLGTVAGAISAGFLFDWTGPFVMFGASAAIALAGAALISMATGRIRGFDDAATAPGDPVP